MASRIQGITVEIGGDTTKLTTALKGVNSEIRNTQSQLRDVEKLLKLDPGNTELLSQKQRLLNEEVQATKEKLEALKTASEQANAALEQGRISKDQYDALQREIIATIVDTVPRLSPEAAVASRTPAIPSIICVVDHPAFAISVMASATSPEENAVVAPKSMAVSRSFSNSAPVAPVIA